MAISPPPSKEEINRCGKYLVDLNRNGSKLGEQASEQYMRAFSVLDDFRALHQIPTSKITKGLRSMVRTATADTPVVSQRLKRAPRIIRKLIRLENSMLARLEDVGGSRAVLSSPADMEKLCARIEKTWSDDISRRRNYVETPNSMGYRAIHFTVRRDDRKIEVQLRTQGQQVWANAVEMADSRLGLSLKDGVGPESMLMYFTALGDLIYHQEYSNAPSGFREALTAAEDVVIAEGYYSRRIT